MLRDDMTSFIDRIISNKIPTFHNFGHKNNFCYSSWIASQIQKNFIFMDS